MRQMDLEINFILDTKLLCLSNSYFYQNVFIQHHQKIRQKIESW